MTTFLNQKMYFVYHILTGLFNKEKSIIEILKDKKLKTR